MLAKSRRQQNNLFGRIQQYLKANLKIHIHLFYTYHLGELWGYLTSDRFNIALAREKWNQLHQKGWQRSLMSTDKDY